MQGGDTSVSLAIGDWSHSESQDYSTISAVGLLLLLGLFSFGCLSLLHSYPISEPFNCHSDKIKTVPFVLLFVVKQAILGQPFLFFQYLHDFFFSVGFQIFPFSSKLMGSL